MSTRIPNNVVGLQPVSEAIPTGGPLLQRGFPFPLANEVWTSDWIDALAWGYLHVQGFMACLGALAGALRVEFSDMGSGAAVSSIALPAVPGTGAIYDSGAITPSLQYLRLVYTQPASGATLFNLALMAQATAGAGVPPPTGDVRVWSNNKGVSVSAGITSTPIDLNHEALDVNLAGAVGLVIDTGADATSLPAPNPSSYVPTATPQSLLVEPDGALRTRARVTTDEGSFIDDFPVARLAGAPLGGPLTGTCTFINGNPAVTGAGTKFTTELRVGDYVKADADGATAWAQVASVQSDVALTLVAAYTVNHALVAASRQNYVTVIDGGGTGVDVPAPGGVLRMAAQGAVVGRVILARGIAAGSRKASAPLEATFTGILFDAAEAAILGYFGFADGYPPVIPPLGTEAQQRAWFVTNGAGTGFVSCQTASAVGGFNSQTTLYALPSGGVTTASHVYRVLWLPTAVRFYVDGILAATHVLHLPDPYRAMSLLLALDNLVGGGALNGTAQIEQVALEDFDYARATVEQPDGTKLHMTVDAMPAVAINVDMQGQVESLPAPNPSSIRGPLADLALLEEPDHALRTRARALTDEGSFNDDYNGANVWTALPGTLTLVPGSTALVGTAAAIAALKAGDYVEIAADDLPATPAWTQVLSIDSATTGTLAVGYAGVAGGAALAARRSPWIIQYTGAGAGITTAASVVTITAAPAGAGVAFLTRRVSVGNRKGFRPVRIVGNPALSAILPNQLAVFGFCNGPDVTAATASATVRANNATTFRLTVVRNGFLNNYDYVLPTGLTSEDHIVELEWTNHGVNLWVDRVQAFLLVGPHIADPYDDLYAVVGVWNTGNPGGAATLTADVVIVESYNQLDALVTQPDPNKLFATVNDRALARTLPAPNPSAFLGTVTESLQLEPDGALRSRARVLTDEGAFDDDFHTNLPPTGLPRIFAGAAVCVFTTGSTMVTGWGSNFLTSAVVGDYLELNADHSDAVPVWAQIDSVESDTALTLRTPYAGLGGAGGASICNWNYQIVSGGVGPNVTTANSLVSFNSGTTNGNLIWLRRALGAGGLKRGLPARVAATLLINNRYADQQLEVGLTRVVAGVPTASVKFAFRGVVATLVEAMTSSAAAAVDHNVVPITLAGAGTTAAAHRYQFDVHDDHVTFTVDGVEAATADSGLHLAGPYDDLELYVLFNNTNVVLANGVDINEISCENLDVVAVDDWHGNLIAQQQLAQLGIIAGATSAVLALPQSLPAPDPSAILGAVGAPLQSDPDHALRTRGRITTDEATFNDDFPLAAIARVLTSAAGNTSITMTTGSTAVVGVNSLFTTEVRVGDYVELTMHDAPLFPVWAQVDSIQDNTHLTLRTPYTGGAGAVTAEGSVCNYYVHIAGVGALAVAGSSVTMTLTAAAGDQVILDRALGAGGRKSGLPAHVVWNGTIDAYYANQQARIYLVSDFDAPSMEAAFILGGAGLTTALTARTTCSGSSESTYFYLANGGDMTTAYHTLEIVAHLDYVAYYVDGLQVALHRIHVPYAYTALHGGFYNVNSGASTGTVLTTTYFQVESLDSARVVAEQGDASKLNVTVGGAAGSAMIAVGTYLPGWAGEFYGPTAALVAVTPTLLMASPNGGYYAVTVDPIPAAGERVRTLWSRPIPVTGVGYTGFTLTGPAQITVGGTILPNIAVGQFVYFTADGSQYAQLVTVVAPGAGLTVLTLGANYLGAAAPGLGSVCGVPTGFYPTVPPISDGTSPVVLGPLIADDVIIVYADVAYAGGIVGCARAS